MRIKGNSGKEMKLHQKDAEEWNSVCNTNNKHVDTHRKSIVFELAVWGHVYHRKQKIFFVRDHDRGRYSYCRQNS